VPNIEAPNNNLLLQMMNLYKCMKCLNDVNENLFKSMVDFANTAKYGNCLLQNDQENGSVLKKKRARNEEIEIESSKTKKNIQNEVKLGAEYINNHMYSPYSCLPYQQNLINNFNNGNGYDITGVNNLIFENNINQVNYILPLMNLLYYQDLYKNYMDQNLSLNLGQYNLNKLTEEYIQNNLKILSNS